ncbi:ectonucleotide pyrophosphatase/phosphodiesterase [Allosphingosinicella sp.]|uniref:alkaline phosphatase family protein n=1 Tax=Allosphingosinicella sp. TaxID=2823234 RepID=UPI0037836369
MLNRLLLAAVLLLFPIQAEARAAPSPITILISIDGFRPDYLHRGHSPRLDALAASGASARMRPSFPSKTFPNHWTIVTGVRPDRHGITANRIEDPADAEHVFTMSSDDPAWWNAVPPIWVDAERAGIRTATMFWPGSNVAWGGRERKSWPEGIEGGTRPSDWLQFNQEISDLQRVNAVLDWLRRPAAIRPRFVTLYFDTVDTAGHNYGPADPRTAAAVAEVDRSIGLLVDGAAALGRHVNFVIVGDHGMAEISRDRVIGLDQIAPPEDYHVVESGAYATLTPAPGREEELAAALLRPHDHMQCWRRADIPGRFHYGTNARIPPFLCLASLGWLIIEHLPADFDGRGAHGFDNELPDMATLFIANGPAIRRGLRLAPFDNVDVYPLLARLIGVMPHSNDGNPATLAPILRAR